MIVIKVIHGPEFSLNVVNTEIITLQYINSKLSKTSASLYIISKRILFIILLIKLQKEPR